MWGRKRVPKLPTPWVQDQDAGWVRYFPDKTAPTHRVEIVGPVPDRGWDFTVYEYGDGAPEAITGGSRATFNDAVAAGSDAIERLQALDLEQPPADERDSVGNLKVKHESLRQRRIRVAELAVGVARIELREIKTRPGEGYAAIARARLAVERAKLEVETIKAESTEITHVTVQDPDAAMAALKKHSEALADQRGRTRRRRSGGR